MAEDRKKCIVTFLEHETGKQLCQIEMQEGDTVLAAEQAADISATAYCGGQGTCGKCTVLINGEKHLACQTRLEGDLTVEIAGQEKARILTGGGENLHKTETEKQQVNPSAHLLGAIDIGTTSLVAYLLDEQSGEVLGTESCLNPQKSYGADVVSRCSYVLERNIKPGDENPVAACIRGTIDEMLQKLCTKAGRDTGELIRICMVGNSGMHHLFLGLDTRRLALAPYTPVTCQAMIVTGRDLDFTCCPDAKVIWLPLIGGFVGADTVGCLVATDMDTNPALTLMIDIGTNGEIVLGNCEKMVSCSTAAGPAFEGAKITCGMRGSEGAIDKVWIEEGTLKYHVIGEGEPVGICGSGLLDAAACLLELEWIDESGRMEKTWYFTDKVFLNQKDVRELQLAKAAIAAGIEILCEKRGCKIKDIQRLLIAGAFGNYMNPVSACKIGLLPKKLQDRIIPIGNAAGEGAKIVVQSREELERSRMLSKKAEFIELALDPNFQDVYIDELEF